MSKFYFDSKNNNNSGERFFRITANNFPSLVGLSIQDLDLNPNEVRQPHLHPNAMQMDYCLSGKGQVGIIDPEGGENILDLTPGDAAYIPQGYVHWIKNISPEPSRFILIVNNERPQTIEIEQMNDAITRILK